MRRRLRLVTNKEQDRLHQLSIQCDFSFAGWEDIMFKAEHLIEDMMAYDETAEFSHAIQSAKTLHNILDGALARWQEYIGYRMTYMRDQGDE